MGKKRVFHKNVFFLLERLWIMCITLCITENSYTYIVDKSTNYPRILVS